MFDQNLQHVLRSMAEELAVAVQREFGSPGIKAASDIRVELIGLRHSATVLKGTGLGSAPGAAPMEQTLQSCPLATARPMHCSRRETQDVVLDVLRICLIPESRINTRFRWSETGLQDIRPIEGFSVFL